MVIKDFIQLYKEAEPHEKKALEDYMLLGAIYELVMKLRDTERRDKILALLSEVITEIEEGGEL